MTEGSRERDRASDLELRVGALESVFGEADPTHLHGAIPFFVGVELGGTPDIVSFSQYTPQGKLYVTAELVGSEEQPPNRSGQYELAVCLPEPSEWALDIVCRLAGYTLKTPLEHGETMDMMPVAPEGSTISALLFRRIAQYELFSKPANVICCVGITAVELEFCFARGSRALMGRMPKDHMATRLSRESYV